MPTPTSEIEKQIEAAYDFRGHALITLKDGQSVVGYIFNREFANPKAPEQHFIEVIPKDTDERRRIPIASLERVELTGKDYAAGNSFEDYLKRKSAQK